MSGLLALLDDVAAIAKVAAARKRTPQQIDAVAQGRVWTGAQALERGLVDRLGSYGDALTSAAQRGKLAGADSGDYRITYLEGEPGRLQQLLELFGSTVSEGLARQFEALLPSAGLAASADLRQDLQWLNELTQRRQPFALAVHCLCSDP